MLAARHGAITQKSLFSNRVMKKPAFSSMNLHRKKFTVTKATILSIFILGGLFAGFVQYLQKQIMDDIRESFPPYDTTVSLKEQQIQSITMYNQELRNLEIVCAHLQELKEEIDTELLPLYQKAPHHDNFHPEE